MPLIAVLFFAFSLWVAADMQQVHSAPQAVFAAKVRQARTIGLAEAVNDYIDATGTLPADIATLQATSGFEYLRQYQINAGPHGNGADYFASPIITEPTNGTQYQRAIVYFRPDDITLTNAEYLDASHNACGSSSASQDGKWCGAQGSIYWQRDTQSLISSRLIAERIAQQRTLQKLARVYSVVQNNKQVYPALAAGNGSAATLISQLTGYTGSAATCSGIWNWSGIPFDCSDLYTVWGTPRVYNYLDEDHIALYADSPYTDSTGTITVASQLDSRRN